MATNNPTNSESKEVKVDKEISYLQVTLEELKKRISERRKMGYDTYISELLLTCGPSQIRMFDASRSKDDYSKCLYLFQEIDRESRVEVLKLNLSEE